MVLSLRKLLIDCSALIKVRPVGKSVDSYGALIYIFISSLERYSVFFEMKKVNQIWRNYILLTPR